MNAFRLKFQIFIPLLLGMAAMIGTFAISFYRFQQTHLTHMARHDLESMEKLFDNQLASDVEVMEATLDMLLRDQDLKAAMLARDRQALLELASPIFKELTEKHQITHFYFTGADRINILRVHEPEKHDDEIACSTLLAAQESGGNSPPGLELGSSGTLTLRIVTPWYDENNQLLGYIELGEEIEHLVRKLHEILGVEIYLALQKKFLDQAQCESGMRQIGRQVDWDRFVNTVLIYQTTAGVPEHLSRFLAEERQTPMRPETDVLFNGRSYRCGSVPLKDAGGTLVGDMVVLTDISGIKAAFNAANLFIGLVSLATCIVLITLFYLFISRVLKRMREASEALALSEQRLTTLVENSPISIQILDQEGVTVQINRSCQKLWGVRLEDLNGYNILQDEQLGRLGILPYLQKAYAGETVIIPEAWYDARQTVGRGEARWVRGHAYPVLDDRGAIRNVVLMHLDITEQKKAVDALQKAHDELESRVEERTRKLSQANTELQEMIAEKDWAEMALRRAKELSETILNAMRDSICLINADDYKIIDYNESFKVQFGAEKIIQGQTCYNLTHKSNAPCCPPHDQCPLKETLISGQTAVAEHIHFDQSGEKIYVEITTSPIKDESGRVCQAVHICRDVTERRRIEAALKNARDEAEKANRAKSEFLANMSHELRTPLNAILGFTQLMGRDPHLSETQLEEIGIINRSGHHLLELINNVLAISKIEAVGANLNLKCFDFHHFLQGIAEMFQSRAVEKMLKFSMKEGPDLPRYIKADEGKLRQVLINLLGNAIKCTERGCIKLRVKVKASVQRPAAAPIPETFLSESKLLTLHFEIEDTGIGIAPEQISKIFDPFVQSERDQDATAGTGLGLAISSRFVRLMGGEITVQSKVGRGSIFQFEIMAAQTEILENDGEQATARVVGLDPAQPAVRILIVEDRAESRMLLSKLLKSVGFMVREAVDGKEGVKVFLKWAPALILMDMRMPVMDGYEATKVIKATEAGKKTPVIALTAHAFEEERLEILAAGCDDFIRKPFMENEIFEALARHLNVHYVYRRAADAARAPSPAPALQVLSAASLAGVAPELLEQLRRGAAGLHPDTVMAALASIRESAPLVADSFADPAKNFRYDLILKMIEDTGGDSLE